jgi:hypothetical protein
MFHVLKSDQDEIQVMHADGHRYAFVIGERELIEGQVVHDSQRGSAALNFRHDARRFAENEARKAKLID